MKKYAFQKTIAIIISEIYLQLEILLWESLWKYTGKRLKKENKNGKKRKRK